MHHAALEKKESRMATSSADDPNVANATRIRLLIECLLIMHEARDTRSICLEDDIFLYHLISDVEMRIACLRMVDYPSNTKTPARTTIHPLKEPGRAVKRTRFLGTINILLMRLIGETACWEDTDRRFVLYIAGAISSRVDMLHNDYDQQFVPLSKEWDASVKGHQQREAFSAYETMPSAATPVVCDHVPLSEDKAVSLFSQIDIVAAQILCTTDPDERIQLEKTLSDLQHEAVAHFGSN
jgi:hypothetical protein